MFGNLRRVLAVCVICASLLPAVAKAQADTSTVRMPSAKEMEIIRGKMAAITADKDPVETSNVIASLKDFPYRFVLNFVFDQLNAELSRSQPNTYHIAEYLNSVAALGSVAEVPALTQLYEKFRALTTLPQKPAQKLDAKFLQVREEIRANPTPLPSEQAPAEDDDASFQEQLLNDASGVNGKERQAAANVILTATSEFMTDRVRQSIDSGKFVEIIGRDKEVERAVDTLVRIKGKTPIFIGVPGVGKTAAADRLAQILVEHLYPDTDVFDEAFNNAAMIRVTPAKISRLAKSNDPNSMAEAIEKFFDSILIYEKAYAKDHDGQKKPIIVFIDEFHSLTEAQVEALLPYMDSRENGISVLGASNSDKFQNAFKNNEALLRRVEQIGLEEFDEATTIKVLKASWIPVIEEKYHVEFTPEAIEAAVKVAPYLQPDTARPDGPFKVLQGIAIRTHRLADGDHSVISDAEIYDYAKEITGLPVNPHDGKAFQAYLKQKEDEINSVVVEQKPIVHKLIERVGNLLVGTPRRPQVIAEIGTTGTGKTLIAETLAEKIFGSKRRALIIDGNDYQTGDKSVNTLVGAPNGVITSDKRSGVLCEYLDDPSRGKYGGVIVINEAEKMHPDAWKRLMEFFDKGVITCGDGKARHANRHVIILTSNRGAKIVFPDTVTMWSQDEINQRVSKFNSKAVAALFKQKTDGNDEFQLPPEVLGRVDEWVIANPGSREGAIEVGNREAARLKSELDNEYHLKLDISPEVIEHLSLTGFSVTDGYRFVAKQIDSYLKSAVRDARAHWDLSRGSTIHIGLLKNEHSTEVRLEISNADGDQITIAAPEQKLYNPLQDKEVLEKLKNMHDVMNSRIIGQDAAVRSVIQMVLAKYADAGRKTAVSFAIVGPTGVGKTEIGRAIAEALYGSPDRVQIIPLGDVNFEGKLNNIFNAPHGYVDSHKIGLFEQALMNTPDGGVIVFDEFSNMGGGDKAKKDELFKQYFYQILDEGSWTSSVTGITYNLRNHIFEFTGNDLQELFAGLNTDKARLDMYEEHKSRAKVRAGLLNSGVPEALLGRFSDIILAKPLLSTEMKRVTEKELKGQIRRLEEQHKGLKIDYDDAFLDDFTRSFFTSETGGRSVRSALDNRLGALVGKALMDIGEAGQNLTGYRFKLYIQDNLTRKPYRRKNAPERKVILGIKIYKGKKEVTTVDNDFTEFAPEVEVPFISNAKSTAYHEAGHAVLNDPELTNMILDFITIRSARLRIGGKLLLAKGYASYKSIPGADLNPDFEKTIASLAKSWAGQLAQQLAGLPPEAGWSNDLLHMRQMSTKYLTTWGLEPGLVGVAVDKDGEPILRTARQRDLFEKKQNELLAISRDVALDVLKQRWPLVRAIVAELMKKGDINGDRAQEIAQKIEEKIRSSQDSHVSGIVSFSKWEARLQAQRAANSSDSDNSQTCSSLMARTIRAKASLSNVDQPHYGNTGSESATR